VDHALTATELAPFLRGNLDLEPLPTGVAPLRLPASTRPQHADGGIDRMSAQTSGVRLRLLTAASTIRVDATFTRTASAAHPARPLTVVAESDAASCRVDVDEGDLLLEQRDRTATRQPGSPSHVQLSLERTAMERVVTIWLPHTAATLLHGLTADAPLRPAPPEGPRWLHYGSSISHGSDLADPRSPWPQQVARHLGLDLVNLGFAGNAMLDPFVARSIAAAEADVVTLKIGINIVNGDVMRARAFVPAVHGFLDLVRQGHPSIPVVVITALACPIHEDATGPVRQGPDGRAAATPREIPEGDGSLTLRRTRELIEQVVASRGDVTLVDGLSLLGVDDGHLPDNLHPDRSGHDLIADRFAPVLARLLG